MDPDIAPLARRLAEENNVDWRRLEGSGSDGRIVERDVLDFLSRVMAGEEAVDPTPEPLPEGMEAWPEEQRRPGTASSPGVESADDRGGVSDDDLLLAGDDLIDTGDDVPLLSGDEGPHEAVPDLFDESAPASERREPAPELFMDDQDDDDRPSAQGRAPRGAAFDFGGLPGAEAPAETTPETTPETTRETTPEFERGGAGDDELSFGDADALCFGDDDAARAAPIDAPPRDEEAPSAPAAAEAVAEPTPESALAESAPAAPAPVEPAAAEPAAVPPEAPQPPAAASPRPQPDLEGLPLARARTVVRRHVAFGPMLEVRRSVALEAGRDDLPISALVLLAARRAAGRLDVGRPGVAVPAPGGVLRVVVPQEPGLARIADAIDAATHGGGERPSDEADLWIVDLSGVGVDEAVLDADTAQLVLGRVLTDGDDGSVRATLSLVADVPVERGAAFLARVADLLEEPLRLLA